jgi:hypothetical protein
MSNGVPRDPHMHSHVTLSADCLVAVMGTQVLVVPVQAVAQVCVQSAILLLC